MRFTQLLDAEWREMARSLLGRRRLRRWAASQPALAGYVDLQDVLDARRVGEAVARPILLALSRLAPEDEVAARTLLQALLPRIVRLASAKCADDPTADEDLVALAWERIRTYPATRTGSVAANVTRDAYKRYRADHQIKAPRSLPLEPTSKHLQPHPSAEDDAMSYVLMNELVAARDRGLVSGQAVGLILRTRIGDTPLRSIAAEASVDVHTLVTRRWRAEARLRRLPLAG
jgi:hypothetical protein